MYRTLSDDEGGLVPHKQLETSHYLIGFINENVNI